jgi:hypothetical protein
LGNLEGGVSLYLELDDDEFFFVDDDRSCTAVSSLSLLVEDDDDDDGKRRGRPTIMSNVKDAIKNGSMKLLLLRREVDFRSLVLEGVGS